LLHAFISISSMLILSNIDMILFGAQRATIFSQIIILRVNCACLENAILFYWRVLTSVLSSLCYLLLPTILTFDCTVLGCGTVDLALRMSCASAISIRKVSFCVVSTSHTLWSSLRQPRLSSLDKFVTPQLHKMASSTFDVQAARSQFPALAHDQVYFDNVRSTLEICST
jgi:hypothetical protein